MPQQHDDIVPPLYRVALPVRLAAAAATTAMPSFMPASRNRHMRYALLVLLVVLLTLLCGQTLGQRDATKVGMLVVLLEFPYRVSCSASS